MDTKVNFVIIGLFVVGLTLAIVVASIWIAGGHHTKHYEKYLTFVDEAVDGLTEKSVIKFNGVDVGFIYKMGLNPSNPQEVRLELKILEGTPINQSTVATIRSQGLTGYSYMGLHALKQTAPPLKKPKDEPYPVIPYSSSLFKKLDSVAQDVSENVTKVTNALSELLGEENQKYVRQILSNISDFTKALQVNTQSLDSIFKSTDKLLKNTSAASEEFDLTVTDLRSALKSAKTAADNFSTVSKQAKQILPNAYTSVDRLKRVMTNFETLSDELTRNPSMLVRGKRPQPAGPGE